MNDHDELRERLLARLAQLEHRVGRIASNLRHEDDPIEQDFEEQATQREHDDVLGALDDAGRRELAAIRSALLRIESGDYGVCRRCGEAIATERLRVLPTALECVGCAA
jgi:DnaK suppressor protein